MYSLRSFVEVRRAYASGNPLQSNLEHSPGQCHLFQFTIADSQNEPFGRLRGPRYDVQRPALLKSKVLADLVDFAAGMANGCWFGWGTGTARRPDFWQRIAVAEAFEKAMDTGWSSLSTTLYERTCGQVRIPVQR